MVHWTASNGAKHKHKAIRDLLGKNPRTPYALHADLGVVAEYRPAILSRHDYRLSKRRRAHQVPSSSQVTNECIVYSIEKLKLFFWTQTARDILQKVIRTNSRL
jgi:hypothetical protein